MSVYTLEKKGNINSAERMQQIISAGVSGGSCYLITKDFTFAYHSESIIYTKGELVYWDLDLEKFLQFTLPVSKLFTDQDAENFNKNFQAWAIRWFGNLVNEYQVKLPQIINDTWYLYDYSLEEYVSSGFPSVGDQGPQGYQGPQGPQGYQGEIGPYAVSESFYATSSITQTADQKIENFKLPWTKVSGEMTLNGKIINFNSLYQSISLNITANNNNNPGYKYQEFSISIFDEVSESVISTRNYLIDTSISTNSISISDILPNVTSQITFIINCLTKLEHDFNYEFDLKILGFNEREQI